MELPSLNMHSDPLQLLPMQHTSAHAARQLWEKAWNDTMQRMAVMVDCLQILATDLGIHQDVKLALAGENGAAEVQSIATSVVGAVNKLLSQKVQDHHCEQRSPRLREPVIKTELGEQAAHDGERFPCAPEPNSIRNMNSFPVYSGLSSLKASSQRDVDEPLGSPDARMHDAFHAITQGRKPEFAPHPGEIRLNKCDSVAHIAAAPSEPLQTTSASGPRQTGVTTAPHHCPRALKTAAAVQQPQIPDDGAPVCQEKSPTRAHDMLSSMKCPLPEHKISRDGLIHVGECTPPRPAAMLRETCLATPLSQRPRDEFSVHQQGHIKDSHKAAQMTRVDRYGIMSPVVAGKQQGGLSAACDHEVTVGDARAACWECARVLGCAAELQPTESTGLIDCEAVNKQAFRDDDVSKQRGCQQPLPLAGDFTSEGVYAQPLTTQAHRAHVFDSRNAELGGTSAQESDYDEGESPSKPVWRVLGAQAGAKPQHDFHDSKAPCDVPQSPATSADHPAGLHCLAQGAGGAQQMGQEQHAVAFQMEKCSHHNQDPVNTEQDDAFQDDDRENKSSAMAADVVGTGQPSERSSDSVREGGSRSGMKGKRKAAGVWKARKANILVGKATKQGKSSGRIDRMLSHLNVPRTQQGNVSAVTAGQCAQGLGSVAPAPVKGIEHNHCSEENLERKRLAVHAKQTAMRDGGPKVYDERVRKRAEREALPAWDCQGCAQFYAMLERQGYKVDDDVVRCPDCVNGLAAGGDGSTVGQRLMQDTSRHRHRFVAPPTPKNFWAIGFNDDWHGNGHGRDV